TLPLCHFATLPLFPLPPVCQSLRLCAQTSVTSTSPACFSLFPRQHPDRKGRRSKPWPSRTTSTATMPTGAPTPTSSTPSNPAASRHREHHHSLGLKWLGENVLPRGTLPLFAGPPSRAKSYLALEIAARLSRAKPMPFQGRLPGAEPIDDLAPVPIPSSFSSPPSLPRSVATPLPP